jgi:hypothetical protein
VLIAVNRRCMEASEPPNFRMARLEHAYPECLNFVLRTAGHNVALVLVEDEGSNSLSKPYFLKRAKRRVSRRLMMMLVMRGK